MLGVRFFAFRSVMTAVLTGSVWLYVLFPISHFLILIFVPLFWGRENLWMFISVTLSVIPVNVIALLPFWRYGFEGVLDTIISIFILVLCYVALFSAEQLVMGVITRLIWKRQLKLPLTNL